MGAIEELQARLDPGRLPRHIAIIMDGNGRWAEGRGLPRLAGHREGSHSVRAVTRLARRLGVQALTLYALSPQNWKRPVEEVAGLMDLLREYLVSERAEIMDNGIRFNALGELDRLPHFVRAPLDALMAESAGNRGMVLSLARRSSRSARRCCATGPTPRRWRPRTSRRGCSPPGCPSSI